jgi:hypothetical protein
VQLPWGKISVDLSNGERAVSHELLNLVDADTAVDQPRGKKTVSSWVFEVLSLEMKPRESQRSLGGKAIRQFRVGSLKF